MQKKILISFAMSGMAAFPALADVQLNQYMGSPADPAWSATGMEKPDYNGTGMSCGVGVGDVVNRISLPQGTYTFSFKGLVNADVTIDGKAVAADKNGNIDYKLVLESAKELEVVVSSHTAGVYSFESFSLVLNFDVLKVYNALTEDINGIEYNVINNLGNDVLTDEAYELEYRRSELIYRQNQIQDMINNIGMANDDVADPGFFGNLKYYSEYKLYATPNVVAEKLDALIADVEAFNDDVDAINIKYRNYSTNKADFAKYTQNVTDFLKRWEVIDAEVREYDLSNDYLKSLYDRSTAVNQQIIAFKQLVDATYATEDDFFNAPSTELADKAGTIETELTELQSNVDTASADMAAWRAFWGTDGTSDQFNVAYREQMTLVGDIDKDPAGIDEEPDGTPLYDAFGAYKAEVVQAIDGVYEAARKAVDGTTAIKGFAAKADALKKTLADAETEIADMAQAAVNKAREQRELYKTDVTNYQAKDIELKNLVASTSVPAEYQEELDARIEAAREALAALNDYYVDGLKSLSLAEGADANYNDAFNLAVQEIKNLVDKNENPVVYLTNELEALKRWVYNQTYDARLTGAYEVDVNGKFTDTYKSIQDAIDAYDQAIKDDKTPAATVDQIEGSINNARKSAQTIIDSFSEAQTKLSSFGSDVQTLNNWADAKIVLPETEKEYAISSFKYSYMTGPSDACVETKYNSLLAQYQTAAAVEGFNCVKAAEDVVAAVDAYNPGVRCAVAEVALTKVISGENKDYVNNLVDDSKTKADEYAAKYESLGGLGFKGFADRFKKVYEKVEATLATANAAFESLNASQEPADGLVSSYAANWTNIDRQYETALSQFAEAETAFNNLVANMKAYEQLMQACGNLSSSLSWTESEYVANCPTAESKTFYQNKVNELKRRVSTLVYNVESSAKGLTAVSDKAKHDAEVTAINKAISDLQVNIKANTDAYNKLFKHGKDVRDDIDKKIAELQNPKYSQEAVAENIKVLEELRDKTLYDYNQAILDLTNKGEINSQLADYTDKLEQVAADAQAELNKAKDEYTANVANVNEEKYGFWKLHELEPAQKKYTDAVNTYKAYESLTNKGLVNYLNFKDNSAEIYKYNALIRKVDEDLKDKIRKLNIADPARVITDADIQKFTNELTGYESGIDQAVATTNDAMNALSIAYYATLDADAKTAYDRAKTMLDAAGIATVSTQQTKSVFQSVTDALKLAESSYTAHSAGADLTWKYMNDICNNLDFVVKAGTDSGIQNLAVAAWKQAYDAAVANQNTWKTDIDGYRQFAAPDLYAQQTAIFNEAMKTLAAANRSASADAVLIDNYATYLAQLNAAVASMKQAHDLLKESSDNNAESKDLYNQYIGEDDKGGLVGEAQARFDEVMAVAGDLLARDADTVKAIQSQIDALRDYVKANSSILYKEKENLETMLKNVNDAIANGYQTVKAAEIDILQNTLVKDVKDSFNKKKVDGGFANVDEEKAYESRIAEAEKAVKALSGVNVGDAAGIEKFKTEAAALEDTLCNLNNELNPSQYPTQALDKINAAYDEVLSSLDAAEKALSECTPEVQEKYAGVYPEIRAELEAIKAAYEAEGNKISYLVDYYTPQINAVGDEIAAQVKKVKTSEDNQVAFDGFDSDLQKYETEYKTLYSTIERLISEDEQNWLDFFVYNRLVTIGDEEQVEILPDLTESLTDVRTLLDGDYAAEKLVIAANAEAISDKLSDIENNLLSSDMLVLLQYAAVELQESNTDVVDARNYIELSKKNLVTETYMALKARGMELENRYSAEYTVFYEILKKFQSGEAVANVIRWENVQSLKNAISTANEISEEAKALKAETEDSKWVRGDVNLNPDGIVNIIDVQMIINWVGENVAYQQLYEENARQAMAADINGDEKLNIADVTGVIGIANSKDNSQPRKIGAPYMQDANGSLGVRLVSEENGVRRYAIYLSNDVPFVAGQLDFMLAPGMKVAGVEAGERGASHDFYLFDNMDFARIIVASMENAEFNGESGILGYVDIEGDGKFSVENIIFSDSNTVTYRLKNVGTTKIDDVIDSVKNGIERVYNAAGQQFNKLQKGINIIRHKDGTTTKEMNKD